MNAPSLMPTRHFHAGGGSLPCLGSHWIRHATAGTPFEPGTEPQAVWDQVEQQLDLIGAMGEWEPCVVDATGFGASTETAWAR
jgi:hypothetical protein